MSRNVNTHPASQSLSTPLNRGDLGEVNSSIPSTRGVSAQQTGCVIPDEKPLGGVNPHLRKEKRLCQT